MNDTPKYAGQQLAEDITACARHWLRLLMPDCASLRIVHRSVLRAQAEVLQGLVEVTQAHLAKLDPSPPPASEKIPVD